MNLLSIRPQMRPELSQHIDSLSLAVFFTVSSWPRRPSGCCCTEEPHRRTPATAHRRTGRHVAEVRRLKCNFRMFWRCTVHQHWLLSPQLQHRHRTGLHWDSFISLTGLFSCFLSWAESCALRRSDLLEAGKPPKRYRLLSVNLSPAGDGKEESEWERQSVRWCSPCSVAFCVIHHGDYSHCLHTAWRMTLWK